MRFLEENAVRGVDFTNPMDRAKNTLKLSFNETKLASLEVFLGFQPFKGYGGMCALTARCDNWKWQKKYKKD